MNRSEGIRPPARTGALVTALLAVLGLLAGGCAAHSGERTLTVLAAASLTDSFDELGERFEQQHPGVRVRFDYQGSSTLAEQIRQGRQADVFASADRGNMGKVARTGSVAGEPATFATNRLVIAVPKDNPAGITSLDDLARPGPAVVTCAPEVPCGAATQRAAEIAGTRLQPDSEENDVKSVLRKVQSGAADAGLVYVTDARSAGEDVRAIDFPAARGALNEYPIAALEGAAQPQLASAFLDFVRGRGGREVLTEHGFGAP
ncbi:molybdate ABC transporter substrate-binding protein [Salinifilum aidingensis]